MHIMCVCVLADVFEDVCLTAAAECFAKMDQSGGSVKLRAGGSARAPTKEPTTKEALKKKWSLLPHVKEQLNSALSDMKKSVVNVKKSPWLLTRSGASTDCC